MPFNRLSAFRHARPAISRVFVAFVALLAIVGDSSLRAEQAPLADGRLLDGKMVAVETVGTKAIEDAASAMAGGNAGGGGAPVNRLILMVDDDLRRVFICKRQVTGALIPSSVAMEHINIAQPIALDGLLVNRVGPIQRISPFDQHGRRTFTMAGARGPLSVVQGITEITPTWTKVQGLRGTQSYIWDMRIATTSIPREVLSHVLAKQIDPKKLEDRLKLVRLYLQSERYQDAQAELEAVIQDFPSEERLKLEVRSLQQLHARRIMKEIKLRRSAGQHQLAYQLLEKFPADDVAGETLAEVREMLDGYKQTAAEGRFALESLAENLKQMASIPLLAKCQQVYAEIKVELNINTLDRLADYLRLRDDEKMSAEQKFALAVSGWLRGSGQGTPNLPVAIAQYDARNLIRAYLREPVAARRSDLLEQLKTLEAGSVASVAQLIGHMKPPLEAAPLRDLANAAADPSKPGVAGEIPVEKAVEKEAVEPDAAADDASATTENELPGALRQNKFAIPEADAKVRPARAPIADRALPQNVETLPKELQPKPLIPPGLYLRTIPGIDKELDVNYYVQTPPEYDPYRRYPTIVTLNGAGVTPLQQIDWWSGELDKRGSRQGQGARYGYLVIAVDWSLAHQKTYEYSAREHAAVLGSLRDASRRFSIDQDRVFLSGHSMGGDAAWDIGLAHPDLWAGVIPIVASADKYVFRYWENAKLLHTYFVGGELDGEMTKQNARDLDRYLQRNFDCTVVEYQGRGHEHFHDEIQRLFDWMERKGRNFFPKTFKTVTMRTWDNYFWWLELGQLPQRSMIEPISWPPARGVQAALVEAQMGAKNNLLIKTAADKVTVWLTPELVDFDKPINIVVNGKRKKTGGQFIEPELKVLLEDVRTRGDRQHPFWARVD